MYPDYSCPDFFAISQIKKDIKHSHDIPFSAESLHSKLVNETPRV